MKDWLRRVFGRRVAVQPGRSKKIEFIEVLPSDHLVYGVMNGKGVSLMPL